VAHDLSTPRGLARVAFAAMGTRVEVLLPQREATRAVAVERLFADWEAQLSRFRSDSELSRVNAAGGRASAAGPLLRHVLRRALEFAGGTGGVFDPTLGAAIAAVGYDASFDRIGHSHRSNATSAPAGGWRRVEIDDAAGAITLPAGVRLDLGGIAKGLAVDAALSLLAGLGVETALVNAGGDLAVSGLPQRSEGWPVQVQTHDGAVVVPLLRGAIATSTTARRRWLQDGVERHHLLDPATGLPSRSGVVAATVAADSCELAELAAKVALLLGRERGRISLAERGLSGLLVEHDRSTPVGAWPRPLELAS
jgi:thiamine biosynthesis lipoprotein